MFECGKLYKFTENGEDLPVEHSFQTFFNNMDVNKDKFGFHLYAHDQDNLLYVAVMSGTVALCLGSDKIMILSHNLKLFEEHKYYKLLIDNQVVMLLHKEKNLYSFEELISESC